VQNIESIQKHLHEVFLMKLCSLAGGMRANQAMVVFGKIEESLGSHLFNFSKKL
jgi:hypothetical protein